MRVILASASPRRQRLLQDIVDDFTSMTPLVDEDFDCSTPQDNVMSIARRKLDAVPSQEETLVISADTTVYMDGKYYNKPSDQEQARAMLKELSGRVHKVYTGVCIRYKGKVDCFFDCADVEFNELSQEFIDDYIRTGSPLDKAGAYGIQDKGIVSSYQGDYNTIMGLPLDMLRLKIEEIVGNGG